MIDYKNTNDDIINSIITDFKLEEDFFEISIWDGRNEPRGKGKRISFYLPPEYAALMEKAKKLAERPRYKNLSNFILESIKESVFNQIGISRLKTQIDKCSRRIIAFYELLKNDTVSKGKELVIKTSIKHVISEMESLKSQIQKAQK